MPPSKKAKPWAPTLIPKGYTVFNSYLRYLLVDGPRKSGKTLSCLNKICRHLWEHPGSIVGVVAKTARNAKAGVWSDLINFVVAQWIEANFGFVYDTEPKMAVDTKMSYFRIRSRTGATSECQLHSIEYSDEAQAKFKSTRFSMLYLSEADLWESSEVFDVLADQLRVIHMPFEAHQMIVDCNPPEDGEDHWLYDVFFQRGGVMLQPDKKSDYQQRFGRIQIVLDDNTLLDPREKQELIDKYRHDQNTYNRWVLGLWEKNTQSALFKEVFRRDFHIRGRCVGAEDTWEVIIPDGQSHYLYSGWDLGDTNHAAIIACTRDLDGDKVWEIIDEIVMLHRKVSIADFTEIFMTRSEYWEAVLKGEYNITEPRWRHWSDNSAMRFRAASDSYDELIVRDASDGKVVLHGVRKGKNSVKDRVSVLRKLLFQNRFFVSARCKHVIRMIEKLPPGKTNGEEVDGSSPHKHVFDALTYLLVNEAPMELVRKSQPTTARVIVMNS